MSHDPLDGPPTLPAGLEAERTASGLEYLEVSPGRGKAAAEGSRVRLHYTLWLLDGTLVEGTRSGGEPVSVVLGAEDALPGWTEGIRGMREGGRRRLIVPSDLGYGVHGRGDAIPPYATLIYDVELLETA